MTPAVPQPHKDDSWKMPTIWDTDCPEPGKQYLICPPPKPEPEVELVDKAPDSEEYTFQPGPDTAPPDLKQYIDASFEKDNQPTDKPAGLLF